MSSFFPGNASRAKAYAAIDATTTTRTVCAVAAISEFRNHWMTGVWGAPRMVLKLSVDGSRGNTLRLGSTTSELGLNDVLTMNSSGARKNSATRPSSRIRQITFVEMPLRRADFGATGGAVGGGGAHDFFTLRSRMNVNSNRLMPSSATVSTVLIADALPMLKLRSPSSPMSMMIDRVSPPG